MCGILCVVTSSVSLSCRFSDGNDWIASSRKDIDSFIGSIEPLLSEVDHQKISHHEALRQLYEDISCLKLDVKLASTKRLTLIDEKKREISALISPVQESLGSSSSRTCSFDEIAIQIARRGPDHLAYRRFATGNLYLHTFSSVLLLRQPFTPQQIGRAHV